MITVLFFASLRDQLGADKLVIDAAQIAPPEELTTDRVVDYLCQQYPAWQPAFRTQSIFTAVNQTIVSQTTPLNPDDEVAFFPPVTGG